MGTRMSMPDVVLDPAGQELVLDLDALDARPPPDMVTVRWMWTGSPQPPPASSTTGILQTVRMSDHDLDHLGERQPGLGDALVPAERAAAEIRPP
jgi:hypothetical protein